jgi:hypothetical protein
MVSPLSDTAIDPKKLQKDMVVLQSNFFACYTLAGSWFDLGWTDTAFQ